MSDVTVVPLHSVPEAPRCDSERRAPAAGRSWIFRVVRAVAIAGVLALVSAGASPLTAFAAEHIVDNGQSGTSPKGSWCSSTAPNPYGTSSLQSCGSGADTYTWQTPILTETGTYAVYVWWTQSASRSTEVPYTVVHADGDFTTSRNQRTGGGQWQLLGSFPFTAGGAGTVRVSDANGEASADAVRFVSAAGSFTLTVTRAGTGSGLVSSAPHGINCATDCSEAYVSGTVVALTATPLAGSTFAGWSGSADCSDGSVTMTSSKTCTATFTGTPVAEAVVNNAGPGTSFTGSWCVSTALRPYGTSSAVSCGSGTDTYRFTPVIPATGSYDVYAWWTSAATRSSQVPYTVVHAGGTFSTTKNHQAGGGQWQPLGTFTFNTGTGGYVQVSDVNGPAAADAIRWVAAGGAPPTALAITSVNGGTSPTAGAAFSVVVVARNGSGVPANVSTATGVSLSVGTGTGTLGGTLTGTIAAGSSQATIAGVTYTKAESGVVLTVTRTSGDALTPGSSAGFTVNPGAASALAFTTPPGNTTPNTPIPGPPAVTVRDSQGNTVTASAASVTVAIGSNPGGGTLSGTTTRSATSGLASFGGLAINAPGVGYTLSATSPGLTAATSGVFNVTVGQGAVAGTVSRAAEGRAIGGATVQAFQAGTIRGTDTTAPDGTYALSGLAAGTYDVKASADGYATSQQSGVVVSAGATTTVNVSLTASLAQGTITYHHDRLGRLVAVVDPAGDTATYAYDAVGNLLAIGRQASSQVAVIDFSPGSGPVGATVRILGTGFAPTPSQNTVRFNGTPASVTSSTATDIVATVPAGATTGPISVTTPAGSAASVAAFTVGPGASGAPAITGFTPTIAVTGAPFTISGTGFDPIPANNKIRLNVTAGGVTTAAPTSLWASVPVSAGSGRIAVTTPGGAAVSAQDLFVVPPPYAPAQVGFTGRMLQTDSRVVTLSVPGSVGLLVFDAVAGDVVSVQLTGVSIAQSTVTLHAPTGSVVASASVGTGGGSLGLKTLPASGTYTILVAPMPGQTGSMTVSIGVPDLAVVAVDPAGPITVNADGSYTLGVSWNVQNIGTAPAPGFPSWWDRVYLSTTPVLDGGALALGQVYHAGGLTVGASYSSGIVTMTTPPATPPGSYYVVVKTDDPYDDLAEIDETNNTRASATTVTLAARPDLVVTAVSAPGGPVNPNAGGSYALPISWTVQNASSTPTPAFPSWWDKAYLSSTPALGASAMALGQVYHANGLAPGASYSSGAVTMTAPAATPPGTYYVIVKTDDPYDDLAEADETNNTRASATPVTLAARPDLVVTAVSVPGSPVARNADQTWSVPVSWTVRNSSATPTPTAPSWWDKVYLSTDTTLDAGDLALAQVYHAGGLAGNASYASGTITVTVPASVTPGTYRVIVKTDDPFDDLAEASETNNTRASTDVVLSP